MVRARRRLFKQEFRSGGFALRKSALDLRGAQQQVFAAGSDVLEVALELIELPALCQPGTFFLEIIAHLALQTAGRVAQQALAEAQRIRHLMADDIAEHARQRRLPIEVEGGGDIAQLQQCLAVADYGHVAVDQRGSGVGAAQQFGVIFGAAAEPGADLAFPVCGQLHMVALRQQKQIDVGAGAFEMKYTAPQRSEFLLARRIELEGGVDSRLQPGEGGGFQGGAKRRFAHAYALMPRCSATMPPVILKYSQRAKPALSIIAFSVCWSGCMRMLSAR